MQIEECFLEMICHSRWVFNYCLTRLDARVAEEYSEDLLEFRAALEAISLPHSNVNEIVDVPSVAVEALCKGVCYLLLGEEVLGGNAPTTMHQFLRQTKGRRLESAKQAHIITIRWFVNAGLLQIEDLLQVIYGDTVQLSDYASDYEAQTAVAEALSTPEPFYLGAHVSILRALLLQYCSTIITADDIVSHVLKVDPSATAELYTLEDTLLFWLKSILQLSPSEVCNALTTDLSDVYLHTNDGRILSLVVHYYQPQALTLDGLHLDGDSPTISERQANWSKIISAAESLGLWVGIFASEVVTHGFATLQLHVLRIVEELFAILAVGVENSYKDILNNLGVSRPSSNSASAQHYGGGQVSIRGSSILRNSVRQSLVVTGASAMNHNNSSVGKRSVASSISEGGGVMSANHHDESDYPQADTTIINNTIMTSVCSPEMDHSTAMIGYDPNRSAFTTSSVGDRMVVNHADGEDNDEDCSSHISAMLTGNYSPVPSHRGGGGGDTSVASSIKDGLDTLGPNRGESSSIRREIIARTASLNNEEGPSTVQSLDRGTDAHRTNVTESVGSSTSGGANSGGGDYNIILTNMFLQGVAVPVHRTATTDSKSPPQPEYRSTTNSPPPPASAQLGSLGSVNSYNNNSHDDDEGGRPRMDHQRTAKSAPRFDDTQELSAYVRASGTSSCGSWKADNNNNDHQPTTPRNQSGSALDAPEFADSPAPITQSQDGPVRRSHNGAGSRLDNPPTSTESPTRVSTSTNRRSLIAGGGGDNMDGVNASPGASLLTASLAKLHKDRVSRSSMNILSHSLQRPRVQGSIDEDGIGDLIAELKALSRQAPPEPPLVANMSPPPADELEHQNRNLRAALSHQQKIVAAFIDQFQRGLQNQKQFDVIANHLASSIALPKSGGGGDKPKLVSTAVGQSFAGDSIHQIEKKRAPLSITQQLNSPTPTSLLSLPTPSVEMLDESTYGGSTATTGADYDNDEDNKPLTHGGGKRRHLPGTLIKQSYNKLPVGLSVNLLESQQRREVGPTSVVMESIDNPTPLPALKKVPISMKGGGTTTNTTTATRLAPPAPSAFDVSIDNLRANKGAGKPPPHLLERLEAGAPTNNTKQQHGIIQQRQMVRGRGGGGNNRAGAVIKIDQNTSGGDDSALLPPLQQQHNNHHAAAEVPAGVRIWNNKSSITLALRHALLPGSVNKSSLDSVLGTIEDCIANNDGTGMQQQFVVLLKDEFAHIFRGLYVLKPTGQLTRVFGSGPLEAYVGPDLTAGCKNQPKSPWSPHLQKLASHTAAMHPRFFKFDTSNKKFLLMPHSEANNTTDAITFSKVSKVARERW